ncbi:MAG: hypothetical protein AAGE01_14980 [Pseudomonadota bacterium]
MSTRWIRLAATALLAVALVGCNSKVEKLDNYDGLEANQTVGILPINAQPRVSAQVYNNTLAFAGTAGRIAVTKADDSTRRKMTEQLEQERYDYRQEVKADLLARIEAQGYNAEFMDFKRSIDNVLEAVPPGRFEKRYPKDSGYDFLLDIYVDYFGYAARNLTSQYLPTAHVAIRVVDGRSLETLYQSEIQYNPTDDRDGVIRVDSNPEFGYDNVDDLLEDVPRAKDGLREATDAVLDVIIRELTS